MFGIGKKNETEIAATKVENRSAEDEIQFDFEEDDKLPFDDDEGFADDDALEESTSGGLRQALPQRTLILLGLVILLALGAGGYYFLNSTPAPPSPPPAPVKTKVAAQPVAPALIATPVPAAVKPNSPISVAAVPVSSAQPKPAAKEQTPPVAKVVPAAVAVVATVEKKDSDLPTTALAIRQPFTLAVGAFISPKHQRDIEKKIRRLGYTPKLQTTYSMVPMTRLLLGVFDPTAAEARRKELVAQVPDLFALKQGDKVALYAGSYQSLDQARSYADQLYLRGIHVDEVTVSLKMPLKKISYGSFSSRVAAEKAAKRAVAAGLMVQVVKR